MPIHSNAQSGSGIINKYSKIVEVFCVGSNNQDSIRVDNPSAFTVKDTILIHQSKGASWNYTKGINQGHGFTGRFEFHIISKIIGDTIVLRGSLSKKTLIQYDVNSGLQAVRVPSYNYFKVDSTITAKQWDGNTGGIVAFIVDTLELNANIDVTGKGFRGGNPTADAASGLCWFNDTSLQRKNFSVNAVDSAGLKGESVVNFNVSYMRGRMNLYSGGGGGNGYHSGGGGGANYGKGGDGGYEATMCDSQRLDLGGFKGLDIKLDFSNTIEPFATFGGGGGSSTQTPPAIASAGGNGGGAIIIMANVVIGNNYSFLANGENVSIISTAGGGGGGAGGCIIADVNEYVTQVTFQIRGGKGGSTSDLLSAGPGGGGGGGYVLYNGTSLDAVVDKTNGKKGLSAISGAKNATDGTPGDSSNNLVMPTKEFLFNIMPPDQEICAGEIPAVLQASKPKGGSGKFKFKWLQTTNKSYLSDLHNLSSWDSITNTQTYAPPALFDTTFYIRVVSSYVTLTGIDSIVAADTSFYLTINVLPVITNDSVYTDTTNVCKEKHMPYIVGSSPGGGNGSYTFEWQDSTTSWTAGPGNISNKNYYPPHTDSANIRRVVKSGVCRSYSKTISINVLPLIAGNIVQDTQWVQQGTIAKPLKSVLIIGGDGIYTYLWQQSTDLSSWSDISTNLNFAPPLLTDTLSYRRIITSGQFGTCIDTSNIVTIHVLDTIQNNFIAGTDTICSNSAPIDFTGTTPIGGDKKYYYQWEKSTDKAIWDSITTLESITTFNPGIIQDSVYFRRIALSGPSYSCKDTSNIISISTRPFIKNNIILHSDTTICQNQTANQLLAAVPLDGDGPYTYTWQVSTDKTTWNTAQGSANNKNYITPVLFDTTFLRRHVESGVCSNYSDTITIAVLGSISNNLINTDQIICRGSYPDTLRGSNPNGGETANYLYKWIKSQDKINWSDVNPENYKISYKSDTIKNKTYFKRIVYSGLNNCCKDTSSLITIDMYDLPISMFNSFSDSTCIGSDYAISIIISGKPGYNISYTDGNDTFDIANITTNNYNLMLNHQVAGVYNYRITSLIDSNNCIAEHNDSIGNLSVFEVPVAFAGNDTSVCGLEISLTANAGIGNGLWKCSVPATFEPDSTNPNVKVTSSQYGQRYLTWQLNNGGCIDSSSREIIFYQNPPNPLVGKNQSGPFLFQTNLEGNLPELGTGHWTTPDKDIVIYNETDPYTLVDSLKLGKNYFIWNVVNGVCRAASDTLTVEATDLKIPNGFSPNNNDTINQMFYIKGLNYVKNADLTIINKWGKTVYHSSNYQNDWDGTYKGNDLVGDTYFYILNVIGRTYKGFVVIRR